MSVNKTIFQQKLQVFFRRVSTENQSLEMQIEADKKFRDQLDDDEYIEVNELAISANKIKLKDREKLLEVIRLIENGEVSTVYVYDRSRLARNFYEYLQLVDLFITHDVEVVFTTTDASYSAFTSNYLVEGFNGILIEEEGKAIARRVAESHRKLPSKKFGLDTNKSDDGKKNYTLQLHYKEPLLRLFETASEVSSATSFIELLSHFSRVLKKQPTDILRMLTDSFYTGHEQIGNRFSKLSYVEPLLTLELYKTVQVAIKPFIERLQNNLDERSGENVLHPYCDICNEKWFIENAMLVSLGSTLVQINIGKFK
ncbi:recombinase family protein [Anaerobacillus sp. CMMVII]|uniref:recombinase family protein n=1 Tax=Anaerobacillus sp. CMMVII TaxID=2755588 RepID=UPI0021B827FD|nr:recombinase family protein [Anaerobacillus sp. CMMVII]MCT8139975.1 recombinase family protein [Anaerobacillus sp. CMMVII]